MRSKISNYINKFIRAQDGAATVEFAMAMVSFIFLIPVTIDIATVIHKSIILSSGVRAGVQYAITSPDDNSGITQVIRTASGLPSSDVSVTVTQFCQCAGVSSTCGSICSSGAVASTYDTITASYAVPIILPYDNYPNNSYNISRSATVQVK
jgi:Flp pilus assembly protein TadG